MLAWKMYDTRYPILDNLDCFDNWGSLPQFFLDVFFSLLMTFHSHLLYTVVIFGTEPCCLVAQDIPR